jgi:protein translocase SecG subunit
MITTSIFLTIISILIIGSILLQKSANMGLGAYESDVNTKLNINDSFLSKLTSFFIFIWICIIIYINYNMNHLISVVDKIG